MNNEKLIKEDLAHIWHPCSQMKDYETLPLIPIKKGRGVYIEDYDGNIYIDAISSWWVNLFGHTNPYIAKKIKKQVDRLEHIIFAGFSHKPIIKLSKRLINLMPKNINKCFYADNGSSAVEVALKMSFHYYKNQGKKRLHFVSLTNSYHGETLGAMSVSDVGLYKEPYKEMMMTPIHTPVPYQISKKSAIAKAGELEKIFQQNPDNICALIVEPLVQCAGSMNMYHPLYLKLAYKLCKKYDIHFIADEIAVGFGRTGTMFAFEQAKITPDFICLSKGITGGFLPLAVVLTTDEIYGKFYCDYSEGKSFLHSHSYTGNPIACAAANATLDIFEKNNVIKKNLKKIKYIKNSVKKFQNLSNVKEVRQTGMITAIELKGYEPQTRIGLNVYQYALKNGVLLRPLGNIIYFMPPYVIKKNEIDKMINVAYEAIKSI